MDRSTLKIPFTIERIPEWRCPTCNNGILRLDMESFKKQERLHSRDHSHEAWEPEWIDYVYSCLFICSNDICKDVISCTGTGSVDINEYEEEDIGWVQKREDLFKPKFFEPHLNLFHIPPNCPDSIVKPLHESFRLFFASPSAASNSVRVAIEELLTELNVKRFIVVTGQQRRIVNLHQRINLLPTKYSEIKGMLTAIKWLGNAGSHGSDSISTDDVMDAYDLTEHVLCEIYEPKTKKLATLAKKINKKKGPTK